VFEPVCLKDVGNLTEQPFLSPLDAAARASMIKSRRKSPVVPKKSSENLMTI
jgi:hypothetical protein